MLSLSVGVSTRDLPALRGPNRGEVILEVIALNETDLPRLDMTDVLGHISSTRNYEANATAAFDREGRLWIAWEDQSKRHSLVNRERRRPRRNGPSRTARAASSG